MSRVDNTHPPDQASRMLSTELILRFRIIGRHAYADGAIRAALLDPQVNAAIATMPTGVCVADIVQAWLAGWDDAQMTDQTCLLCLDDDHEACGTDNNCPCCTDTREQDFDRRTDAYGRDHHMLRIAADD